MTVRTTALAAGVWLLLSAGTAIDSAPATIVEQTVTPSLDEVVAYVCPMHVDYTSAIEGVCPMCGMRLVVSTPYDIRDYRLTLTTTPTVVRAGAKARLQFRIFHPGSGEPITSFETVHDRQYHLFVISQDMTFFEHIHPELDATGTWSIDVVLPKPGYYKLLSDFLPSRGTSQFLAVPLVTAGYTGDLVSDSAHLVPDTTHTKTVGDLTVTVTYEPQTFVPGEYSHLMFYVTDARTGRAVSDLQTYLGAFGHTLIMSEDMTDYVHSHPLDLQDFDPEMGPRQFMIPPGVDPETLRGGPEVTFEGLIPRPGRYRAWTQFRRHDKIHTFAFTLEAMPAPVPAP